jgi:hypothetical protein
MSAPHVLLSDLAAQVRRRGMLNITADTHLDHALVTAHLRFILDRFRDREAFFIETLELPAELPDLRCALYGPRMGDAPMLDEHTTLQAREGRPNVSRLTSLPPRSTRLLTVVAGPHAGFPCMLYTAFGGPATPREPGDPSLTDPAQAAEAQAFWAQHALAK